MNKYLLLRLSVTFVLITLLQGCFLYAQTTKPNYTDPIILGLYKLKGHYEWNNDLNRFIFAEKLEIENVLSTHNPDDVVPTLAECLDDPTLSNSTMKGKPVVMGIICYEALSQTAYYESTLPNGDISPDWPGHVTPSATMNELKAAKAAWMTVVATKSYHLL